MSTSIVARRIFEDVRKDFPEYFIKFSSDSPRNPANLAGPEERKVIDCFNANPEVRRHICAASSRDSHTYIDQTGVPSRDEIGDVAVSKRLGYSHAERMHRGIHDIDPGVPKSARPAMWQELKRQGSFLMVSHHETKSGELFPVEIRSKYYKQHDAEYNFAIVRDLPDYRKAQIQKNILEKRLRRALKMEAIGTVAGGEDAVAHLKDHPADLVVLDMIMDPGIDGLETYRRIVDIRPGQKAIIVSGFSESARVKALQRLGAGQYVRKPYTMEKLAETVKQALDS